MYVSFTLSRRSQLVIMVFEARCPTRNVSVSPPFHQRDTRRTAIGGRSPSAAIVSSTVARSTPSAARMLMRTRSFNGSLWMQEHSPADSQLATGIAPSNVIGNMHATASSVGVYACSVLGLMGYHTSNPPLPVSGSNFSSYNSNAGVTASSYGDDSTHSVAACHTSPACET